MSMLQESATAQAAGCISQRIGETNVNCPHALGRHRVHVENVNSGCILSLASHGGVGALNGKRPTKRHAASGSSSSRLQVSAPEHRYHFAQHEDKIPGLRQGGGYRPEDQWSGASSGYNLDSEPALSSRSQKQLLGQALGRQPLPSNSEASSDYFLESESAAPSRDGAPVSCSGSSVGRSDHYLDLQPGMTAKAGVSVSRSGASECSGDFILDAQPGMLTKAQGAVSQSSPSQVSLISSARGRKDHLASTPRMRQRSVPARLDAPELNSGASNVSPSSCTSGGKASRQRGGTPRSHINLPSREYLASTPHPRLRSVTPRSKATSESDLVSSIGSSSVSSTAISRSKQSASALSNRAPRTNTCGQMKGQKPADSVASSSTRASQMSGTHSSVSGQEQMESLRQRMKQRVQVYKASAKCGSGSLEPSDCGTVVTAR